MTKRKIEINQPDDKVNEEKKQNELEEGAEVETADNAADIEMAPEDKDSDNTTVEAEETEEEAIAEKESDRERFLRVAAEFDNYKKRRAREFTEIVKRANFDLLRKLVEIVDNFELALNTGSDEKSFESYKKGVELIYAQFNELLTRENVAAIEAVGKPFDPNLHEAMMQEASDDYDEGIIVRELQKGYIVDDRVLRHARVVVSSGKAQSEERQNEK